MTNKSLILNLYKQTIDYLDLTFLDSNLIELVKTKDDFKKIIINLLTFIVDCEDQEFVDQKNQQRLLAAFSAITGSEFVANSMMTYKTDEELDAEVKSFDTYLVKNLDKNFEQIKSEFKSKHVEEQPVKVESEVVGVATASTATNNNNANSNNQNEEFDAEKFFENNRTNFNNLAESMIESTARSMLSMNIRRGSVYQFKTKPKIIPILKWIIVSFIGLLIALSVASFALLMVAGNHIVRQYQDKNGNMVTENSVQLTSPFPFQLILTLLILFMMISSIIKYSKNENSKYYMSWGWMLIYVFVLGLTWFLMGGLGVGVNLLFVTEPMFINDLGIIKEKSQLGLKLISAYKALQFTTIALLGVILILTIVGSLFNPKKDVERMQQLLNQYISEIKDGTMSLDSGANDFGRFFGTWF